MPVICNLVVGTTAIDEVRAQEAKELMAKGYEAVLTKTRWLLLTLKSSVDPARS